MVVKIVCPLCGENLSIEDINFTQDPHTKSEQLKTFMVRDCESQFVTPFFFDVNTAVVVDM